MTIAITDVVLRDAHQSRSPPACVLTICCRLPLSRRDVGYGSLDAGAAPPLDACIRFLGEGLRLRLRELKSYAQNRRCCCAPEPARLPPLRRRRGSASSNARGEKRHGMCSASDAMNDPRNMKAAFAGGAQPRRARPWHTLHTTVRTRRRFR